MSHVAIQTDALNAFFDKPRMAYAEFLRRRLTRECEGILHLTRTFLENQGRTLMCDGELRNAIDLERDFMTAEKQIRDARSVADVRLARVFFEDTKQANAEAIDSLMFALSLVYGLEVN